MAHTTKDGNAPCRYPDGHEGRHRSIPGTARHCKCASHDGTEPWHGTIGGYGHHDCRCDLCRTEHAKRSKAYQLTNPDYFREKLWIKGGIIGMTWERFQKMMADQGGCCYLCHKDITGSYTAKTGERLKAQVDHDHAITDRDNVRHLLCRSCNAMLGWLENKSCQITSYLGWPLAECEAA